MLRHVFFSVFAVRQKPLSDRGLASGLLAGQYATLLDAGFLAGETAEVVKFGATNLTVLVYGDGVDEGRLDGEDTLHTDVVAHLADSETFFHAFAGNADNYTAILLNTLFVTFFDAVSHGDGVTGTEFGKFLAGSKSLFGYFN